MSPRHIRWQQNQRLPPSEFSVIRVVVSALLVSITILTSLPAQMVEAASSPQPASPAVPKMATVTHHVAVIGGKPVQYTATAGMIEVTGLGEQSRANLFYIAYTVDRHGEDGPRPLTFAYNGGPGGSAALVHMAAFGPRTIRIADAADPPPSPRTIIDNPDSLLDVSDLVFIDPVGSGYSRLLPDARADDFYGVAQDAHVTAQFIRRYIDQNDRWSSAKYLAGESYGTLRSAVTAKLLQQDGLTLAGLVLMSTILDNTTLFPQAGNDEPYWLFLPSEAAVAADQHRIATPPDLDNFLREVRVFAGGLYLTALAQGSMLPQAQQRAPRRRRLRQTTRLCGRLPPAAWRVRRGCYRWRGCRPRRSGPVPSIATGRSGWQRRCRCGLVTWCTWSRTRPSGCPARALPRPGGSADDGSVACR